MIVASFEEYLLSILIILLHLINPNKIPSPQLNLADKGRN
jgi:hypothetical protein